jgi:hypothetical protein
MRISNWEYEAGADFSRVSAEIDGFRLWYRAPKAYTLSKTGDAFLAAALLPAMRQGEKLEVDPKLPVSGKLLGNLAQIQDIFHSWNPKDLRVVPVSATAAPGRSLNAGVQSFFSGGVDSAYTFLRHQKEITHVVCIHGFDFFLNPGATSVFTLPDLKDLSQLAWKITQPKGAVAAQLNRLLADSTRQALSRYRNTGAEPAAAEAALLQDLNRIVAGPSLYEPQRFAGVSLRQETQQLLGRNPQGAELANLNRMLLEDAFPMEISGKQGGQYVTAVERNTRFVESFGKKLIPIETNYFPFGYRYNLGRNLSQGGCLGGVAELLGFPRVYIPASYSYNQLFPLGSHPLLDYLWSNEGVEILHDGCEAGRTDKLRLICQTESALMNLRVCFNDANENCGKCLKCLRTMVSLKLFHAPKMPFPPLPPPEVLRRNSISGEVEMAFFDENVELARQCGEPELRDALVACKKRHDRVAGIKKLDQVLLGGFVLRQYRKYVKAPAGFYRIDTTPVDL